ncbi:MAG: glycosyltransferase family 1 protein [Candidatus Moraniibacteriota bacterium]
MKKKNNRLKIGINASYLRKPNTGIGQVTANFLKNLARYKQNDLEFILYLEEDISKDFEIPDNFTKKIFLPMYRRDDLIRKIWWEKFLLPRRVKKDECDVFISMYQCPTSIQPYKEVKHIMIVHDIIPKLFSQYLDNVRKKLYWKLTEYGIKKADKIIAVSKRTEKDLIEHLNISADKITTNYIDVDDLFASRTGATRLASTSGLRESRRANAGHANILNKYKLKSGYILAGGGYEVRKNVEGVVRAYKLLLERNKKEKFLPDFPKLVIYGKILPKNLSLATDVEKLLRELNLTTHVKLLGEVPQKDLPALFREAVMFVYPSHYEGFGMQILEAMNVGTSAITSKVSSLPEVGGDSVLYCNPDDIMDIAMVMKNVLTNKDLRDQLKSRGMERAKQFSWEKFIKKILNIIEEI